MLALIYGKGVVQVGEDEFPVAPPFAWVNAPEGVTTRHRYVDGAFVAPETPVPTSADVNAERDRRIRRGFQHNFGGSAGVRTLDCRGPGDDVNWLGLKGIADALIAADEGATLLELRDAADETFAASATTVAAALVGMAQWRGEIIAASWALKDAPGGIPADFTDDAHWP